MHLGQVNSESFAQFLFKYINNNFIERFSSQRISMGYGYVYGIIESFAESLAMLDRFFN